MKTSTTPHTIGQLGARPIVCAAQRSQSHQLSAAPTTTATPSSLDRRHILLSFTASTLLAAATTSPLPALAEEQQPSSTPQSSIFTDAKDGFSINIPSGWLQGTGSLSAPQATDARSRFSNAADLSRVVAWFPENKPEVSVSVTIRTPSADFTSLGSFGNAEQFGQNLVNQMDRSFMLRGPKKEAVNVTVAKLVNAEESNGQYRIIYTVSQDGLPERTVYSNVAMGTSPTGLKRLFTVNGSCLSEEVDGFGGVLKEAVSSFTAPPM